MRNELPKPAKKSKATFSKPYVKKITKKAKPMAVIEFDADSASNTDMEEDSDEETQPKNQTPKRKRPSDYIAKKDRPENLKSDKKINQLSLDEAISICKLSPKRAKLCQQPLNGSFMASN